MAETREDRLQGRMRGAGRHQVADVSFHFGFSPEPAADPPAIEQPAVSQEPSSQAAPNSSAKRRKLSPQEVSAQVPRSPANAVIQRASRIQASSPIINTLRQQRAFTSNPTSARQAVSPVVERTVEEITESPADAPGSGQRRRVQISAAVSSSRALQGLVSPSPVVRDEGDGEDEIAVSSPSERTVRNRVAGPSKLGGPVGKKNAALSVSQQRTPSLSSNARQRSLDEAAVAKAATKAPHARVVMTQKSLVDVERSEEIDELSSPVVSVEKVTATKTRSGRAPRKTLSASPRSSPAQQRSRAAEEPDELSPEQPVRQTTGQKRKRGRPAKPKEIEPAVEEEEASEEDELVSSSPTQPTPLPAHIKKTLKRGRPSKKGKEPMTIADVEAEEAEEVEEQESEAEEIDDAEAARHLGRKRPRISFREASVDLSSPQPSRSARQDVTSEPTPPARRKRSKPSPAPQKQPQARLPKSKAQAQKPNAKPAQAAERRQKRAEKDGQNFQITVQRLKRVRGDNDADELAGDVPSTVLRGQTAADVMAQLHEEVIQSALEKWDERLEKAADRKQAVWVKKNREAVRLFGEHLVNEYLEHASQLDLMLLLKKRVAAERKRKFQMREELMRLKAEHEQNLLRMDAIRAEHEAERTRAMHHSDMSKLMHDVDIAVEGAQNAPDLTPEEVKELEVRNLELLVARLIPQACSTKEGGGNLNQIKDFNGLLERAAEQLEGMMGDV